MALAAAKPESYGVPRLPASRSSRVFDQLPLGFDRIQQTFPTSVSDRATNTQQIGFRQDITQDYEDLDQNGPAFIRSESEFNEAQRNNFEHRRTFESQRRQLAGRGNVFRGVEVGSPSVPLRSRDNGDHLTSDAGQSFNDRHSQYPSTNHVPSHQFQQGNTVPHNQIESHTFSQNSFHNGQNENNFFRPQAADNTELSNNSGFLNFENQIGVTGNFQNRFKQENNQNDFERENIAFNGQFEANNQNNAGNNYNSISGGGLQIPSRHQLADLSFDNELPQINHKPTELNDRFSSYDRTNQSPNSANNFQESNLSNNFNSQVLQGVRIDISRNNKGNIRGHNFQSQLPRGNRTPLRPDVSRRLNKPNCSEGEIATSTGQCVEARVSRNIYVYEKPKPKVSHETNQVKPSLNYNILFIKDTQDEPELINKSNKKTIVYVLNKEPINENITKNRDTHEVYFVKYREGDNPVLPHGQHLQTELGQFSQVASEQARGGDNYHGQTQHMPTNNQEQQASNTPRNVGFGAGESTMLNENSVFLRTYIPEMNFNDQLTSGNGEITYEISQDYDIQDLKSEEFQRPSQFEQGDRTPGRRELPSHVQQY